MNALFGQLFFLFGACLPFVVVGPQIANNLYASPSIFIGALIVAVSVLNRGATWRLLLLVTMILVFVLTSLGRHSLSTYALSAVMLLTVMAPMCLAHISASQQAALTKGFILGLCATLVLVWFEIVTQILGLGAIHGGVANIFRPIEQRGGVSNFFVLYQRPYAAFSEPAHLAIHLVMSLLILDVIGTRLADRLRALSILSILFVGSVVGYVLLLGYLGANLVGSSMRYALRVRRRTLRRIALSTGILAMGVVAFAIFQGEAAAAMVDRIAGRFIRTFEVVQEGRLTGSEGSRANTFRILFDYWEAEGLSGFFFGTGYGNISRWLIENYGHLDRSADAAHGRINSIIVANLIATGFFGIVIYFVFILACLKRVGRNRFFPLFFMFLLANFSTGTLIVYSLWHILAIIILLTPPQAVSANQGNRI